MDDMDISRLCRSCMKEVISWEQGGFEKTFDMFYFCTNIKIKEADKLPKQFCCDCLNKIEVSYTFIKEAQKVNVTLKNIISRNDTRIIVENDILIKLPENDSVINQLTENDSVIKQLTENDSLKNFDSHRYEDLNEHFDIELKKYEENINTNENNELIDKICNIDPSYKFHIKSKNGVKTKRKLNDLKRSCPICKKKFKLKSWLDRHVVSEHTGNKYICDKCPKTFPKQYLLRNHAISHSKELRYSCSICGGRFKQYRQLKQHSAVHDDARPFTCDHCGLSYKTKNHLKCHIRVHTDEKPHLCSICGRSFAQSGNLTVHLRTHSGAKPYSCSTCSYACRTSSSLRRHARCHLAGDSREAALHRCYVCGKRFFDSSGLARHSRRHTGALPYICALCGRGFIDSWKRKTHLMRQHKMALSELKGMPRNPGVING